MAILPQCCHQGELYRELTGRDLPTYRHPLHGADQGETHESPLEIMTVQEAGSAETAGGEPPVQAVSWYVGRDGQQYGPVGDPEFWAMLASGQILQTDLVWRDGFAEWTPASAVRPPATAASPASVTLPPSHAPSAQSASP